MVSSSEASGVKHSGIQQVTESDASVCGSCASSAKEMNDCCVKGDSLWKSNLTGKKGIFSLSDNRSPGCSAGQFHQNQCHGGLGLHQSRGDGRHSCSTGVWQCQAGVKQSEFPLHLRFLS